MEVKRWELMPHVYLTYLPARKFKTGVLSAQFITPLAKETASYNALLPAVLHRGTMRCPDMEQLAAAMDRLYGAQISPTIRKRGETQCLGFVASFIDDRFVSRNEPLLEPAAELLGELLLDPSAPSATTSGTGPICGFCRRCAPGSPMASAASVTRRGWPRSTTRSSTLTASG